MRIDSTTAKKFVLGQLTSNAAAFEERIREGQKQLSGKSRPRKTNAIAKAHENRVRSAVGENLIHYLQIGRKLCHIALYISNYADGSVDKMVAVFTSYNLRSKAYNRKDLAVFTKHALERLLERRHEGFLIKVVTEEFNVDVMYSLFELYGKIGEHKISTTNGTAVVVVQEGIIPTVVTWYK